MLWLPFVVRSLPMDKARKMIVGISPVACILAAFAVLIVPMNWFLAAFIAAAVHELFHYGAVRLCGGRIRKLRIGSRGAVMDAVNLSPGKMLLCVLAGPLGGLFLLFIARWFPRIAICAAFQSAYNLLPLEPLDGGRALRCCLAMRLTPPTVDKICDLMTDLCKIGVVTLAAWSSAHFSMGILPIAAAVCILLATKKGKSSCKQSLQRVQ